LVVGAIAGIAGALWYAPQSGRTTREELQRKSEEAVRAAETTVSDVRHKVEGESISEALEAGKAEALRFRESR
jgi:gas vesicle protein